MTPETNTRIRLAAELRAAGATWGGSPGPSAGTRPPAAAGRAATGRHGTRSGRPPDRRRPRFAPRASHGPAAERRANSRPRGPIALPVRPTRTAVSGAGSSRWSWLPRSSETWTFRGMRQRKSCRISRGPDAAFLQIVRNGARHGCGIRPNRCGMRPNHPQVGRTRRPARPGRSLTPRPPSRYRQNGLRPSVGASWRD
jgi:hypothetical protein